MEEEKPRRSLWRSLLSIPLRFKITIPYLVVASLVAGLATFQVSRSFAATLEERFRNQLLDSAIRVAEGVVNIEEAHLQSVRTIGFTAGVADAFVEEDFLGLESLVFPTIVNNRLYDVDLLDVNGQSVLSWHRQEGSEYQRSESTDYTRWEIVKKVLAGESDDIGDKYVDIIDTPWGFILYTAGPIRQAGELVGIVLVGTPLSVAVHSLSQRGLADVSIYNSIGQPVASSLGITNLPQVYLEIINVLPTSEKVPTRSLWVGTRRYIEAVEALYLRGQQSDWIFSVALPEDSIQQAGGSSILQMLGIFAFGILVLIGLGVAVAQLIAIPVFRLLDASQQVGSGNLAVQVEVFMDDEIGMLTRSFNRMIKDLRQREFMREMFGRMVSEDVSEAILHGDVALGGESRYVSVLFTDVRGYTGLSEEFSPGEVIALLNQFFAIIAKATKNHHGVINHFGGDSVLAVFGAPIERSLEESLQQAIRAAIEIRLGVDELNAQRISEGVAPLRFGLGVNSGSVIAGNVGTEDRFEYTVIGDVVNVAARLQGISRQFPRSPLLVPSTGVEIVRGKEDYEFQYLGEFRLRGKSNPVPTYTIVGLNTHIPKNFTLFDGFPYPRHDALLAVYLHCQGFDPEVIAETMQLHVQTIESWLKIATANAEIVSKIITDVFGLPMEKVANLGVDSNKDKGNGWKDEIDS
jgi:class 3 adenylate cyclase